MAELDGIYRLCQVLPWDPTEETGLMRQYRVQLSPAESPRILCQTDLYQISGSAARPVQGGGQLIRIDLEEVEAEAPEVNESKVLEEIRAQLKDISRMKEQDCKKALRRLYLTWHPDQAGDTEFNNKIFRLLRDFEDWYRNGGGDDRWLKEWGTPKKPSPRKKGRKNRRKPAADPVHSPPKTRQAGRHSLTAELLEVWLILAHTSI